MFTAQSVENHRISDIFRRAAQQNQSLLERNGLVVQVGEYQGCPFLKLDKPKWHNRGEVEVPGEIFFSIWQDASGRLNYNIHALKLRHLTRFKLQSRKFASAFRAKIDPNGWPNISTAFGPQTLMQGWINDATQIDEVINHFCTMHSLIDELLGIGS